MMIDSGKLKARAKEMCFQPAAEIIRVIEEEEHGNCGHSVHCDPDRDCDRGRYREAEDMSELLSREKVLMYLSDVQLSIAPTERDEGSEHRAHEYAYTVLEWVMENLKSMPGEKPNVHVLEKDADCISRQAAIDNFTPWLSVDGYSEGELNMLKAVLYDLKYTLPSAEKERKPGKWIGGETGYCSVCGHSGCASDIWNTGEMNYCPNRGAKMEVEQDEQ